MWIDPDFQRTVNSPITISIFLLYKHILSIPSRVEVMPHRELLSCKRKMESIISSALFPYCQLLQFPKNKHKTHSSGIFLFCCYKSHQAASLASFQVPLPPIIELINFPASLLFVLHSM